MGFEFKELSETMTNLDNKTKFNPDKRIDSKFNDKVSDLKKYDPDKRINFGDIENKIKEKFNLDGVDNSVDRLTTLKERIDKTPTENNPNGYWEGERGLSKYVVTYPDLVKKYGKIEVPYKDGEAVFDKYSKANVKIEMTSTRYTTFFGLEKIIGNFNKADVACAKQWNDAKKDGRTDWTARDVKQWRHDNKYTWHECNDRKTCQLVPQDIHDVAKHSGGVRECRRKEAIDAFGGTFDA